MPEYTRGKRRAAQPRLQQDAVGSNGAPAGAATAPQRGSCAGSCAARPARTGRSRLPAAALYTVRRRRLFGFAGPKAEAEEIKAASPSSCVTTSSWNWRGEDPDHARPHPRGEVPRLRGHRPGRPQAPAAAARSTAHPAPRAQSVIKAKCAPYLQRGKPASRPALQNPTTSRSSAPTGRSTGASSSTTCWPETSGAGPAGMGHEDLHAQDARRRHRSTVTKMAAKYKAATATPYGPRTLLRGTRRTRRAGSRWSHGSAASPSNGRKGGHRRPPAARPGHPPERAGHQAPGGTVRTVRTAAARWKPTRSASSPTSTRPGQPQPEWARLMARKRRKTLIVCVPCHAATHAGNPPRSRHTAPESRMPGNGQVRFGPGAAGKGPAKRAPRRRPTGTMSRFAVPRFRVPQLRAFQVHRQLRNGLDAPVYLEDSGDARHEPWTAALGWDLSGNRISSPS